MVGYQGRVVVVQGWWGLGLVEYGVVGSRGGGGQGW